MAENRCRLNRFPVEYPHVAAVFIAAQQGAELAARLAAVAEVTDRENDPLK